MIAQHTICPMNLYTILILSISAMYQMYTLSFGINRKLYSFNFTGKRLFCSKQVVFNRNKLLTGNTTFTHWSLAENLTCVCYKIMVTSKFANCIKTDLLLLLIIITLISSFYNADCQSNDCKKMVKKNTLWYCKIKNYISLTTENYKYVHCLQNSTSCQNLLGQTASTY